MSRLVANISIIACFIATPALSAEIVKSDDFGDLRGAYPSDWDMGDNGDPLDFEFGVRYFYSSGQSMISINNVDLISDDKSQILEVHGRIDDNSTGTYLKAWGGYSIQADRDYSAVVNVGGVPYTYTAPETTPVITIIDGSVEYAGVDFGYLGFGNSDFGFGPFIGYQYYSDTPGMDVAIPLVTGKKISTNMLRLGVAARADLSDNIDISAEAAFIPYARIEGAYEAEVVTGGTTYSGAVTIDGALYGAAGEMMIGFKPSDDFTIRVGGRAMYLTGTPAVNYTINDGIITTSGIGALVDFSQWRVGALLELTYTF